MSHRQPWTRSETDELERMLADGHRYADIADKLGRPFHSVRGRVEYLGLHGRGMHWKSKPPEMVSQVRSIIEECVDFRGMPCAQVTRHLNAIGYDVSNAWVYKQLCSLGPHIRQRARNNASRRFSVLGRFNAQFRERDPEGNWTKQVKP